MKNELRRHKKSDRVKWCIAFAAIVLLAAGLTLICLQLFSPYKPSNGFKQAENETAVRVAMTTAIKRSGTPPLSTGSLYDEKFEDGKLTFFNQWAGQTVRLYAIKGVTTDFYDVTGGQRYITLHLYDRQTYTLDRKSVV